MSSPKVKVDKGMIGELLKLEELAKEEGDKFRVLSTIWNVPCKPIGVILWPTT